MTNLLPAFVGNTSIRVEWDPPQDVSWVIRRFEVEWIDTEKSITVGYDMVVGATIKELEDLEFGTKYEVRVVPIGASSVRGEMQKILITTLGKLNIYISIIQDLYKNGPFYLFYLWFPKSVVCLVKWSFFVI